MLRGHGNRRQRLDAVHDFDLIAVGLAQPHAPAAAGFVDGLDRRGARRFRDTPEIILVPGVVREADELGIALLGDVQVMHGIGAAHVERRRRARRADHAEVREEFLGGIEIG